MLWAQVGGVEARCRRVQLVLPLHNLHGKGAWVLLIIREIFARYISDLPTVLQAQ